MTARDCLLCLAMMVAFEAGLGVLVGLAWAVTH
jgi:hypothetical protein